MRPGYGNCGRCGNNRILKGDFTFDVMMLHGHKCKTGAFMGGAGAIEQSRMTLSVALCRHCYRVLMAKGQPQVHLASRGVTERLTRKQAEALARKRMRELAKQEAERETEGGE